MDREWSIRPYQDGDEEAIYELLCAVFGKILEKQQWLKLWDWKYKNNPAGKPVSWVAVSDDKIIAHYAVVPVKMKVGDEIITAAQSVDTMTHPGYQGRGIFIALTQQVFSNAGKQGIDIAYGFPNKMTSWHQKYWLEVGGVSAMIKPLNPEGILGHYIHSKPIAKPLAVVVKLFFSLLYPTKKLQEVNGLTINQVASFDERINDLWEKVANDYKIITVRDKTYLNWRFANIPGGDYTIYIAEKEKQVLGYTVLKCEKYSGLNVGRIFELIVPSGQEETGQSLVLKAIEFFEQKKADFILYSLIGDKNYHQILKKCGFINYRLQERKSRFVARLNTARIPKTLLEDRRNWFVQTGDSDHV